MSFRESSLTDASTQTPGVSANSSRAPGDLTSEDSKNLTLDQFAKLCDITVEELVEAGLKHAEEIHHAAQLALSAPFIELLYAAYAGLANSTAEIPQEDVRGEDQEEYKFLQRYDEWEKILLNESRGAIYLNRKDKMRLCHAFESIASPGQDWSFVEHETLRDHIANESLPFLVHRV